MLKVGDHVRVVRDTLSSRKGDMGVVIRVATLEESAVSPAYVVHLTAKIAEGGTYNNPNRMSLPDNQIIYGKYLEKTS